MPSDQVRKLLSRAARMAAALGGSPGERAKLVRALVEKIIVGDKTIIIKLRRGLLLGEDVASSASEAASDSAVELTAAAAFMRRGAETKLVLPGLAQQKHSSTCDPALIKAVARGRASFAHGQNFREVGLHQCPSERKGEGVPVRRLRVPSHVPSHPQTAAKVRGFSPIASGFTAETDWLLEGAGFEPLVPPAGDD